MIWHFPQYGLAAAAARDLANNLGDVSVAVAPEAAANTVMGLGFTGTGLAISIIVGIAILCINIITTFNYGGDSKGVRILRMVPPRMYRPGRGHVRYRRGGQVR